MHVGEAGEPSLLADVGRRRFSSRSPRLLIAGVLDVALNLKSPVLHVARGVSQRLEWDADLDLESPRRDASLRLPEEVRAQVVLARHDVGAGNEPAAFALHAVGLHTEWIDDEDECASPVEKGVEVQLDVVVAAHPVAIGQRRVDAGVAAVWLERADAEIHRAARVPDEDFRRVGSGALIDRRVEGEAREERRVAPDRLVERAIDADVTLPRLELGRAHGGRVGAAVVHGTLAPSARLRLFEGRRALKEREEGEDGEHRGRWGSRAAIKITAR